MNLPRARIAMVTCVAATAALLVVGPGSTVALAGRMIGSAAIQDNSIRSIDVRDGTVRGVDIKDGSLTAKDFSGTMRGATGPAGPQGLAGPAGSDAPAGLGAFLYISNESNQLVPNEGDLIFDSNGVVSPGFTHAPGTADIMVEQAGAYEVSFSVSAVEPNQFALFANGALVPGTLYGSAAGTQQNNGHAIVRFEAGDVVTLRNHGSFVAVTLQTLAGGTNTNVNASIMMERLAP